MCGDYYIGGRRFASLSDLIGYYSHVSCLLKGEKLLFPVAPPEASSKILRVKFLSVIYLNVSNFNHHSFLWKKQCRKFPVVLHRLSTC